MNRKELAANRPVPAPRYGDSPGPPNCKRLNIISQVSSERRARETIRATPDQLAKRIEEGLIVVTRSPAGDGTERVVYRGFLP